jgi:hypothetical protein
MYGTPEPEAVYDPVSIFRPAFAVGWRPHD